MIRNLNLEAEDFVIIWAFTLVIIDVVKAENDSKLMDNKTCSEFQCITLSSNSSSQNVTSLPCSEYSQGWGLQGSEWGCCGNYEGCCTYASLICYFHDAMCRCCDVGSSFCGPACKPEIECLVGNDKAEATEQPLLKQHNESNSLINAKENVTKIADIVNQTTKAVQASNSIPDDFLDIEALEKTINNTDNVFNPDFELEIEKLLNETESLLNQYDEYFDDLGSGEIDHQPDA